MALGTKIHCIESKPGLGLEINPDTYEYKWEHYGKENVRWCTAAASYAVIGRRIGKTIVIK